jgi:hypothetical protein
VLVSGHHASCLESAAGSTVAQILVPERPSCGQQLSLAWASKEELNQALAEVLKLLGLGLVERVITYLRQLDPNWIKNLEALEQMIKYLERNQGYLPAYVVRKELGLSPCWNPTTHQGTPKASKQSRYFRERSPR